MEAEELLKDVLAVTRDAGFNRVRYIGQLMSQEEQAEFLKGLFNQAVQAREAKSGEALFDYLEAWEEKGMAIVAGRAQSPIELDATPWTPLRVPIRDAKVALVTTGGFYLKSQQPYETDGPENQGDWSFRAIPRTTPANEMDVAHLHYDLSGPREDRNCVFPIDRAAETARRGPHRQPRRHLLLVHGLHHAPRPARGRDRAGSRAAAQGRRCRRRRHHRYLTHLQSVQWTDSARPGGGGNLNGPGDDEQRPCRGDAAASRLPRPLPLRQAHGRARQRRPESRAAGGTP